MMFWPDHDMTGWGYAGMAVGMVLFWSLVIVGIVALIRYGAGATRPTANPQPSPDRESPERVLAVRFAKGEIDESEYRRRLDVIRQTGRQTDGGSSAR